MYRSKWNWEKDPRSGVFFDFMGNLFGKDVDGIKKQFEDMAKDFSHWGKDFAQTVYGQTPFANSFETSTNYRLELAAPGLTKEDFKITVKDRHIVISVEKEQALPENEKLRRKEFSFSKFKRHFRLPEDADSEKVAAKYENGLLIVTVQKVKKTENESGREVPIS